MPSTTFTNGVTLTDDDWFNDLNRLHYTIFGDPTNLASAQAAFFSAQVGANVAFGGTMSVSAAAEFRALACTDLSASAMAGLVVATQAQMEAASAANKVVTPARQHFHPSAPKAWVVFDGTATSVTAGASYNVTSITRNSTSSYTINYTTPFSSNAYAVVASSSQFSTRLRSVSAGACTVLVTDATFSAADASTVCVAAFGDQ